MPDHDSSYPPRKYYRRKSILPGWYRYLRLLVRLIGTMTILYFEYGTFWWHIRSCGPRSTPGAMNAKIQSLVLIGDPQLVDENTYTRRGWRLKLTQIITDRYMYRNYRLIKKTIPSDLVLFLGDLFDGGREWNDTKWYQEARRFEKVFPDAASNTTILSLPGNHDVGVSETLKSSVYERFRGHFGQTSRQITLGDWDLIVLDAIALSCKDKQISQTHQAFLDNLSATRTRPRMLFMHIPPYRAAESACGPLRESKTVIKIQKGYQYQNVLEPEVSQEIWDKVQPSIVFAGDDHDFCDYVHEPTKVHVINVKTFSMAMGVSRPGFQRVILSGENYSSHMCLLPNQLHIFAMYAGLLIMALFAITYQQIRIRTQFLSLLPLSDRSTGAPSHKLKAKPYFSTRVFVLCFREAVAMLYPLLIVYILILYV